MPDTKPTEERIIFKVAVPVPLYPLFDYLPPPGFDPQKARPGVRLKVPFGKGEKTAFLWAVCQTTDTSRPLKPVLQILDDEPLLSAKDLALLDWAARYYHYPLGEIIKAAFPAGLRLGKSAEVKAEDGFKLTEAGLAQDPAQLKRAPKQQALLAKLQGQLQGLTEAALSAELPGWRPAAKALLAKGWLEISMLSEAMPPPVAVQPGLPANLQQQAAIDQIKQGLGRFGVYLLYGVTGSGKTEVYLQVIEAVLAQGLQVLVLLPEISLTPQLEQRFRQRFGSTGITVSHSRLSDNQRLNAWLAMQQGRSAILLGTRSALFTPMAKPGLIVLDEEHDSSYKQQEGFRFSARDSAIVRAKLLDIPVVLGSATPSLESLYNAEKQRYTLLNLPERAGSAVPPRLQLLDIRQKKLYEGVSETLMAAMRQTLAEQGQVLLFVNRRGFAPTLICHHCGWLARCPRCDANLVVHAGLGLLRCHHCDQQQKLMSQCPACDGKSLTPLGLGTERVEHMLRAEFPGKTVIRLDRDSTQRKGALQDYLEQINQGQADIILGTQMLSKGHHFPNVTLAAIVDADSGLFSIDFHAPERLAQLIVQVSGRAGRAEKPGTVILQTHQPEHPLLVTLTREGYSQFAAMALAERKAAGLPPFSYQALLRAQANDAETPRLFLQQLAQTQASRGVQIAGPVAAPMAKRAGQYRYQLLFTSVHRKALHQCLDALVDSLNHNKAAAKLRWSLDVDPIDWY